MPGATQRKVVGRDESKQTRGSAFIEVKSRMPRVLQVHSLLGNLKHKSGN